MIEIIKIVVLACKINIASNVYIDRIQAKESVCRDRMFKCYHAEGNKIMPCLVKEAGNEN